jgi:hypothetical protein
VTPFVIVLCVLEQRCEALEEDTAHLFEVALDRTFAFPFHHLEICQQCPRLNLRLSVCTTPKATLSICTFPASGMAPYTRTHNAERTATPLSFTLFINPKLTSALFFFLST